MEILFTVNGSPSYGDEERMTDVTTFASCSNAALPERMGETLLACARQFRPLAGNRRTKLKHQPQFSGPRARFAP
jgi:hypothetical protein